MCVKSLCLTDKLALQLNRNQFKQSPVAQFTQLDLTTLVILHSNLQPKIHSYFIADKVCMRLIIKVVQFWAIE